MSGEGSVGLATVVESSVVPARRAWRVCSKARCSDLLILVDDVRSVESMNTKIMRESNA